MTSYWVVYCNIKICNRDKASWGVGEIDDARKCQMLVDTILNCQLVKTTVRGLVGKLHCTRVLENTDLS